MAEPLIDSFGRKIVYLRLSVTDRCDMRCFYCMAEDMTFLPRKELLSLEELERVAGVFIEMGTRKIRITGGEPLVRKGVMGLFEALGRRLGDGLDELTLTTNGSRLAQFADSLRACGVRRVNVSMDTLDPDLFAQITRRGRLAQTLEGLEAARAAGLAIKINVVAMRGINDQELPDLAAWAHAHGMDIVFIETMPLGEVDHDRADRFLPLSLTRAALERQWTLEDVPLSTGGPARYARALETGRLVGFITPMTHNFCESCNRVRMTCTGAVHPCLGQEGVIQLRDIARASPEDDAPLRAALRIMAEDKPRGHDFVIARGSGAALSRHMSVTGG